MKRRGSLDQHRPGGQAEVNQPETLTWRVRDAVERDGAAHDSEEFHTFARDLHLIK